MKAVRTARGAGIARIAVSSVTIALAMVFALGATALVAEPINQLKAAGVSMLISEQHLHLVHETADRIYVLDKGVTVFSGTMAQFDASPEVAEKYLMVMQ
ncbi:MAG: hypothetical protein IIA40_00785 [SAR324 cluster bacterium]|nr:hypothetical protein [SAR324 cluster bacterium]